MHARTRAVRCRHLALHLAGDSKQGCTEKEPHVKGFLEQLQLLQSKFIVHIYCAVSPRPTPVGSSRVSGTRQSARVECSQACPSTTFQGTIYNSSLIMVFTSCRASLTRCIQGTWARVHSNLSPADGPGLHWSQIRRFSNAVGYCCVPVENLRWTTRQIAPTS